ncbi:beta-lactamase family protein [Ancylobacter sp. 6x-1]|uniref:Beta-lactamase family protein n=1 Tax=Ancylobacter crimeensis TaxID=2579147 RepID=A0ABT0DA70_9HYPH|nr:serine hydrolase [Ancylobacter crimeensis]MCK0196835.1 beta-lactamase family protein [Ancylobacter crimeensis]
MAGWDRRFDVAPAGGSHRQLSRRAVLGLLLQGGAVAGWARAAFAVSPWPTDRLTRLGAEAERLPVTALVILQDDAIIETFGDSAAKVDVVSVRKSLLGALIGIAVDAGQIRLDATLADLGIDDIPPSLTPQERQATVRDLLMARSGIYHPAAHETAPMKRDRPARGSHAPGTFWLYNNWDFNALGTIYRRATGLDIFQAFATKIAGPIGMQDFVPADGRYVREPISEHPAYPFRLTARDAARFGRLYLQGGSWNGKQIVPAQWVRDSTSTFSQTGRGRLGYGYLWWTLPSDRYGAGAAFAAGYGGQMIAIVPEKKLVVAVTNGWRKEGRKLRGSQVIGLLRKIVEAAPAP